MKNKIKTTKGKRALSVLLALVMVLSVASPAFSQMLGITAKAAEPSKFEVELGFQNLFLFEKWANNTLSSTVLVDGVPISDKDNDGLTTNIAEGSFTFEKTVANGNEVYTAFSMDKEDAAVNANYYSIPVEPNTSYTFSYNVTGDLWVFTPYVFYYDDAGLWITDGLNAYGTPGYGDNEFTFTTPTNASSIQVRFTIGDNSTAGNSSATTVTATVSDIAIYESSLKTEYIDSKNMFSLEEWNNGFSTEPSLNSSGTIVVDENSGTIKFKNGSTAAGSYLWSGLDIDSDGTNNTCYTIAVDPNKSYTLTYSVKDHNLYGTTYFQPFIVELDTNGEFLNYFSYETATQYTNVKFEIGNGTEKTLDANTESIQIVFATINGPTDGTAAECTAYDIGFYENSVFDADFETITGCPHRLYYEEDKYSTYGDLGDLPTPAIIPEGMVFAGWYTEENGAGKYISENTEIHYESLTVYPKFEPAIASLEIVDYSTVKTSYTVGEKFNPTGLVLKATRDDGSTFNIASGYRWSPEDLTSAETQTVTIKYGGKEAYLYNIAVSEYDKKDITVNGESVTAKVANNKYTFDYTGGEFNRYELTYYSDSYVKGTIIFADDVSEDFFLEPSASGSFASYIDNFVFKDSSGNITTETRNDIVSIEFTCLNKDFGKFELYSLTTIKAAELTDSMGYYENEEYKVGIDLAFGGVVSYLEDLANKPVARTYSTEFNNGSTTTTKSITKVDYETKLDTKYGSGYTNQDTSVNLINTKDRGRYLQQSYYGTNQPPYVTGKYNGLVWNYNPVQGGNLQVFDDDGNIIKGNESSKVIDYKITDDMIYIKTRPLDWGKNSDDYPDSYITDSYMEAWYYFESGMIKTDCRFVDYSGYPSTTTTQEMPALYTIEPLNNFVYYDETQGEYVDTTEPDFWGVLPSYNSYNPGGTVDVDVDCAENWAAFTASADDDSFGIGIYSADITDVHYGCFPAVYDEEQYKTAVESGKTEDGAYIKALNAGTETSYTHLKNYRHTETVNPAIENPTSYIAPVGVHTFESYSPSSYSFYITTGKAKDIKKDFNSVADREAVASFADAKIAVPETAYLDPTNNTTGEYYVNNVLDKANYNTVVTEAEADEGMKLGFSAAGASSFALNITNVGDNGGTVSFVKDDTVVGTSVLLEADSKEYSYESTTIENGVENTTTTTLKVGTAESLNAYTLQLSEALNPGETTTIKWEIATDRGEKYTAYTVMYAPQYTVGAVAEGRQTENAYNEISSWITGANGVDHTQSAPLGSLKGDRKSGGTFKWDPLYSDPPTPDSDGVWSDENNPEAGTSFSSTDYINKVVTESDETPDIYAYSGTYVLQTATENQDDSRSASYLGLLTVDKSRYTNTNQIPNLEIGYDVLNYLNDYELLGYKYDSLVTYNAYYTLGTDTSFSPASNKYTDTPSGWTDANVTMPTTKTSRERVVPSYEISDAIDGKYIHALNQATCNQVFIISQLTWTKYSTAGTSVKISVTDKSDLRDAVLKGYSKVEGNYASSEYTAFIAVLEDAATVLGDPAASQTSIDATIKELDTALDELTSPYFALKYDNLFSALEFSQNAINMTMNRENSSVSYADGVITTTNTYLGTYTNSDGETKEYGEAYTKYDAGSYRVTLEPNTEYVFEFDVTTDVKAQAFMFFYNSSGSGVKPTKMEVKIDDGAWGTSSPDDAHWGVYPTKNAHYAVKFTTGDGTTQAGFRFGNTSPNACNSTFSNIKLIDSAHYYEDTTYTKTENYYEEYHSYGTLPTLTRTGYTFNSWNTKADGSGTTVTGADIALEHKTIYSLWDEHKYTIIYNANGGNEDATSLESYSPTYSEKVTLSAGEDLVRDGYFLLGWSTNANATSIDYEKGSTVSGLSADDGATVTLYAVWSEANINVTFDNLFDFSEFDISQSQLNIDDRTDTGFTVTAKDGSTDANTGFNGLIDVVPGKTYILTAEIDFEPISDSNTYDIYINTLNANKQDDTSTPWFDSSNGAGQDASQFVNLTGQKKTVTNPYIKFTAGETTEYIKIRFDANAAGNTLIVNNIRIWEDDGVRLDTANKVVGYGLEYGTLPTPTKTGYKFDGWKNADDEWVTADSEMTSLTTVNLYSQWTERNYGIFFDANGGTGTFDGETVAYSGTVNLPSGLTAEGANFLGWAVNDVTATKADYAGGATVNISEIDSIDLNNTENITFYAVWELTDDSVVDDTVVADFGLALSLSPYSNDTAILSTHTTKVASSTAFGFSTDSGTTLSSTATGSYGEFSIDEDAYTVTYTPSAVMLDVEEITLYSKLVYSDGSVKILSNTLTITPASNIYYEESVMSVKAADATNTKKLEWTTDGTATNTYYTPAEEDVVGFENAYDVADAKYSNGTAKTVTVTSESKNSKNNTFDFVGTGIDIISRCDSTTGILLINVKKEVDGKMTFVKSSLVDTYCADGTFNQTPIFSWSGVHGKYTVEIGALYLTTAGALNATSTTDTTKGINKSSFIDTGLEMNVSKSFDENVLQAMLDEAGVEEVSAEDVELVWFDDNSIFNGGTGVAATTKGTRTTTTVTSLANYIDGFRVYNPLGTDSDAYTEANVSYANVIDNLTPVSSTDGSAITNLYGIAYLTGLASDVTSVTFAEYQEAGPTGELYLNSGKAISFKINRGEGEKVMLGLRAVNGATTINVNGHDISINSATEMYYDISNCITTTGDVIITIENTGSTLVAVNHIKFSGGDDSNGTVKNPRSMARTTDSTEETTNKFLPVTQEDLAAIETVMNAEPIPTVVKNGVVIPLVEEEAPEDTTPDVPEDDTTTDDSNTDTDTEESEDEGFSIFSLLQMLLALIEQILRTSFGSGTIA